jgi:hypothetical protein
MATTDESGGRRRLERFFAGAERFRVGPFAPDAFPSPVRSERNAAVLGVLLGVSFGICFLTGLLSHAIQHPPGWFVWIPRPAGLYRVTQGLHVATGLAAIPLLLAKLWTVYPNLYRWPPLRSVAHAVERVTLFPLVAGAVFMLFSGFANILNWYPWRFFFPTAHYWAAWITIGALVVHIGAKSAISLDAIRGRRREPDVDADGMDRRMFLRTTLAAAALVTLATLGQTVRPMRRLSVLAPRDPAVGPQGFPVNKSAREAGVHETALDPAWRLIVGGRVPRPLSLTLDELHAMQQHEATLPIACVEGWSANARWRGVRLRDVLDLAGAGPDAACHVESVQRRGLFRAADVNARHASDPDTLLALEVNGEPLHIDHGYPLRLIGPNRPGVLQTKWVNLVTVS